MSAVEQIVVMAFGAGLSFVGLWLSFRTKEHARNRLKVLGQEFDLSTPGLVVLVLGCGIFVLPFFLPKEQVSPVDSLETVVTTRTDQNGVDRTAGVSTDIDNPTRLASNVIEGFGIAEAISYYYTFYGGPGYIEISARARNWAGATASAIGLEITKMNGTRLASIHMGYSSELRTESRRFPLGRREQLLMRVDLDPATIEYKIDLAGAVQFSD